MECTPLKRASETHTSPKRAKDLPAFPASPPSTPEKTTEAELQAQPEKRQEELPPPLTGAAYLGKTLLKRKMFFLYEWDLITAKQRRAIRPKNPSDIPACVFKHEDNIFACFCGWGRLAFRLYPDEQGSFFGYTADELEPGHAKTPKTGARRAQRRCARVICPSVALSLPAYQSEERFCVSKSLLCLPCIKEVPAFVDAVCALPSDCTFAEAASRLFSAANITLNAKAVPKPVRADMFDEEHSYIARLCDGTHAVAVHQNHVFDSAFVNDDGNIPGVPLADFDEGIYEVRRVDITLSKKRLRALKKAAV